VLPLNGAYIPRKYQESYELPLDTALQMAMTDTDTIPATIMVINQLLFSIAVIDYSYHAQN